MRKTAWKTAFAACSIAVALALGAVVTATAAPSISSPRTITVIEKQSQFHFVDVGASGPSLGDQFVFSGILRHAGKVVGHDGVHCIIVHQHPARGECEATYKLPGGKITAQTLFTFRTSTFDIAVNGGTGVFRNARGQATIEQQTNQSKITFNLIP
ncbi:MAG TPA: hypothetical protein VEQ37_00140 [Actinomycetota bacterium]|nr:hypothetical protein [Actinomycetota bacterium]